MIVLVNCERYKYQNHFARLSVREQISTLFFRWTPFSLYMSGELVYRARKRNHTKQGELLFLINIYCKHEFG